MVAWADSMQLHTTSTSRRRFQTCPSWRSLAIHKAYTSDDEDRIDGESRGGVSSLISALLVHSCFQHSHWQASVDWAFAVCLLACALFMLLKMQARLRRKPIETRSSSDKTCPGKPVRSSLDLIDPTNVDRLTVDAQGKEQPWGWAPFL